MKCMEIFETDKDNGVGIGDYHPESYFAPIVAQFIKDEGFAYWKDIFKYIENNTDLTAVDKDPVSKAHVPRWQKDIQNLHAHRTLEGGRFGDIVRIAGGFAMRDVAEELGIDILPDNSISPKDPGKRSAKQIKRLVGIITNKAYTELGSPKLDDISVTRNEIEKAVSNGHEMSDNELVDTAKDIITSHIKKKKGR